MRTIKIMLLLVVLLLLAGQALAQDPARTMHRFKWTQPDTTCTGKPMQDGWIATYKIFVATPTDTVYYGSAQAPVALADTASAYVNLLVGVPQSVQVLAVNKWGLEGCEPSLWSDSYIPIPDPPGTGGKPFVDGE